jgi:hypothetical protein
MVPFEELPLPTSEMCSACWRGDHDQCKPDLCLCIDMEHDIDTWAGEVEG